MWTSLLSTIQTINDGFYNEFKQEFNRKMNEKLKIQLAAEKSLYNELDQLCKHSIIKMENNNEDDYKFKRQRLMDAHLSLITSIETSFKEGIIQLLNYILSKQNSLFKDLRRIANEDDIMQLFNHTILKQSNVNRSSNETHNDDQSIAGNDEDMEDEQDLDNLNPIELYKNQLQIMRLQLIQS